MNDRDMQVYCSDLILYRGSEFEDEQSFFKMWKQDPTALKYVGRGHFPPGCDCPTDLFNTFDGFFASKCPVVASPSDKTLLRVKRLLDQIRCCGGDIEVVYEWLLDWMAWLVQKPGVKSGCIPGFISKEKGTGKTTVGLFIVELMGALYAFVTAKPKTDIFGEFNAQMEFMHFALIDECDNKVLNEIMPLLMDQATSPTANLHQKGKTLRPAVPSFTNYCMTSNKFLTMASGDRRSFMCRTTTRYMGDKPHFDELYAAFQDKEFLRVMYDLLMQRDIAGKNLQLTRPPSDTMLDMEIAAAPLEIKFLIAYIFRSDREPPSLPIGMEGLHKDYVTFFRSLAAGGTAPGSSTFGTQLRHLGLLKPEGPMDKTTANHGRVHFNYSRDELHAWMVSKRYMEPDT
jgi:hypothetical protein